MTTFERIRKVLVETMSWDEAEVTLSRSLEGIDSLDILELAYQLEDEFQVTIPEGGLKMVSTVRDLVAYLNGLIQVSPRVQDSTYLF